ncbi:MAG: ATP-binding protein [Leptospiraceae bacterium]|nr:ATP-binding protein [Leptospiraceae bacterium]
MIANSNGYFENAIMLRGGYLNRIQELFKIFPIVAIIGPRQVGKSTLAKQFHPDHFFDLENPLDDEILKNPMFTFKSLKGIVVIDEIQRKPELFPILRVLADEEGTNRKFLILGSASPQLIRKSSESLAGRIAYIELSGLSTFEGQSADKLWIRGGFPRSFLSESDQESLIWREEYIRTFFEKDIPDLGIQIPPRTLRSFWQMISHYNASLVNFSDIGRSFGISDVTVRKYLDILQGTFAIRLLEPYFQNISKRIVKRPKLLLRDSGIFHSLIGIRSLDELKMHPKLGPSWESFCLNEICNLLDFHRLPYFFYRTSAGTEMDLFFASGNHRIGIEIKFRETPGITRSIKESIQDLQLTKVFLVYPGDRDFFLSEIVQAIPISKIHEIEKNI